MVKLIGISGMWKVLISIVYLSKVNTQCLTNSDNNPLTMDANLRHLLLDAKINFTLEALKQAELIESENNLFFSPHSLYEAIMLAYMGAQGTTEAALRNILIIPNNLSKEDIQRTYLYSRRMRLCDFNDSSSNYEFTSANRLWISNQKKIRKCIKNLFYDELEAVDFIKDPSGVCTLVNNWVTNITKGNIQNLIPPDSVTKKTDLILTNAVYFKGLWHNRFDRDLSKKGLFYGSKTSKVVFMNMIGNLKHAISEDLGVQALELPYKGQEVSLIVLLPSHISSKENKSAIANVTVDIIEIRELLERMTKSRMSEFIKMLKHGLDAKKVILGLPRFTIEKQFPVFQLLESMGAGELFKPNEADLRGFLENENDYLYFKDAIHRAKIELNEEGTTAVAATAHVAARRRYTKKQIIFNANHPFVYLIYDRPNHTILFAGIYRSPVTNTQHDL